MPTVIFVVGLPGSGKTEYSHELARERRAYVIDDYKRNALDHNGHFLFSRNYPALVTNLCLGITCIVNDIDFIRMESQQEAVKYLREMVTGLTIEWHAFDKNVVGCKANIERRAKTTRPKADVRAEMAKVDELEMKYCIPQGATLIPVWQEQDEP
jgi:hypothetical protein